jgi:hypothetical protein
MALRIVRFLTVLLLCPLALSAQTNIAIPAASGGGIKTVLPDRFGILIPASQGYGNEQLTANLISNLSFAPQIWNQAVVCGSGTTSSVTSIFNTTGQPTNFWQGATYQWISGVNAGLTGTITSSVASTGGVGEIWNLSGTVTACSAFDQMIVRCRTPNGTCAGGLTPDNANIYTAYTGGGSSAFETSDLSPSSSSVQALELIAPSAETAGFNYPLDANVPAPEGGGVAINLNGSYTLTFRAKATAGTPTLSYLVERLGGATWLNSSVTPTVNATPNAGWTNYTFTFSASENGSQTAAPAKVIFTATGGTVLLMDPALIEAAIGGNPTVFRNAVYQKLLAQHPGILRFMNLNDWGCTFDTMISNAPNLCGFSEFQQIGAPQPYNLNDSMELAVAVGASPWWTFPVFSTTADMANIAAYMSGTCGNGNAYTTIRCNYQTAHGLSTAPWTSQAKNIYLEFGNELWNDSNGLDLFTQGGVTYGTLLGNTVAGFKAAPYYTSTMHIVGSGFILQPAGGWNPTVLQYSCAVSCPDYIDGAPYMYGTTTDTSSTANEFLPAWAQAVNYSLPTGSTNWNYELQNYAHTNYGVNSAIYETNCCSGTGLSSISQATINQIGAGVGSGLDETLMMLLAARDAGIKVQNFFEIGGLGDAFLYRNQHLSGQRDAFRHAQSSTIWGKPLYAGAGKFRRDRQANGHRAPSSEQRRRQ